MSIPDEVLERVALLARLQFDADERAGLAEDLGNVLKYVQVLDSVDTTDVAPMAHAADLTNVLVEDVQRQGLERSDALVNAPRQDGEFFCVPPVLGK